MEITEVIEEGVIFKFLTNPAEIIEENGKVKELRLQIMELGEPDASGRRRPVPVEGKFETIQVDSVISAIGQVCDPAGLEGVSLGAKGTITADPDTCLTNLEGVFAAGDATNRGASIAIDAIAEANQAADAYLRKLPMAVPRPYYSRREVTAEMLADRKKERRAIMSVKAPEVRCHNFESVINGFTQEQARREAGRCLECGCHDYKDCKLIRYANQMPIHPERLSGSKHPSFTEQKLISIERDQGKCILCNLCVRTCSEKAHKGLLGLVHRGFDTVIRPEFEGAEAVSACKDCHQCTDACPTGALKLLS